MFGGPHGPEGPRQGPSLAEARDISVALEGARRALNLGTLRTFPGPSWTLGETLSGVWESPGTFGGRRRVLQSPGPRQEPPVCESSGIFPGRSTVLQEPGRFLERVWYSQGTLFWTQRGPSGLVTLTRTSSSVSQIKFCRC